MGTSHQNVKQLANKLKERGFLDIERDKEDCRAIRLKIKEKSYYFWLGKVTYLILYIKHQSPTVLYS